MPKIIHLSSCSINFESPHKCDSTINDGAYCHLFVINLTVPEDFSSGEKYNKLIFKLLYNTKWGW